MNTNITGYANGKRGFYIGNSMCMQEEGSVFILPGRFVGFLRFGKLFGPKLVNSVSVNAAKHYIEYF